MSGFACPNCGTPFAPEFPGTKVMNCPSCGTSVFVEDAGFRLAGEQGVMHEVPLLFDLGDLILVEGAKWRTVGHARFSYGRGTWDEFWALDADGQGAWISIDEGDVVIQVAVPAKNWPRESHLPEIGATFSSQGTSYAVTETETATCEAIRGELPEAMAIGERYDFANCAGPNGELLSGEFWPGGRAWFLGHWVDPFDIAKQAA